jgi:hypothetical protein
MYVRQDYYADPTTAWAAFVSEDAQGNPLADIYGFGLTPDQITAATADPDIMLAKFDESGMFEFDLNNNWTIAEYPGIISPTYYGGFRRALSHLCDKTTIINVILQGYAARLDVPLPGPQQGLFDPSGIDPGEYPYVYSLAEARAELNAAGFTQGATGPLVTGGDNVRVYPPGHSKAGLDLDPIIFYPRSDSPPRLAAAEMLYDEMLMVGIPVDWRPSTFAAIYGPVFTDRNYHIYTGGWGLGRFPATQWYLYHTFWWVEGTTFPNYVTGKDLAGNPRHPDLDAYLDDIMFATDFGQMMYGVQEGMEYMFNHSVTIPLWSTVSYNAYRRGLLQVINEDMYGLTYNNPHLPLAISKKYGDDTTIIQALVTPPVKINPLYGSDYYGAQVSGYVGDPTMWFAPYNVYRDQPWTARDWRGDPSNPLTWDDGGVTKSKVIWYFREDSYWSDGTQFTAEDFLFGTQFQYAFDDAWNWIWDINHVELADVNGDGWDEAIVYMEEHSMWMFYDATGFTLPKHIFTQATFSTGPNPLHTLTTGTYPVVGGVVQLPGVPTYVESVTGLTRFTDWNLFMSPLVSTELRITTADTSVEVTWWAKGAADGYTMGNVPADEIMISNGALQLIEEVPGAGGYALHERNAYGKPESVPKGEVDFYWYWDPIVPAGNEPRSGYYMVDSRDVGRINLAMGSAGYGPGLPPADWESGCDIADTAGSRGHIDTADYDTATTAGWYLKEFDRP